MRFTEDETYGNALPELIDDDSVGDAAKIGNACEDWNGLGEIGENGVCYHNGTHDNHSNNNMHKITIIIVNNLHDYNHHCSSQCGSNVGSSHPQRMSNSTGSHSSEASVTCPLNFHEQSSQCSCHLNWSNHRSFGCIDPTSERVTLHEQQVDGDELLGLETFQDGSPTPKLSGHEGRGGVSREALLAVCLCTI